MKTKNNKSSDGITLSAVAAQVNHTRETTRRKFLAAGVEVKAGKLYSIREILKAFTYRPENRPASDRATQAFAEIRKYMDGAALHCFSDSWEMEDVLKRTATDLVGLTQEKFEILSCKMFMACAMRAAAFLFCRLDAEIDYTDCPAHLPVPEHVKISVPGWIRENSRRHGMAHLLDAETVNFSRDDDMFSSADILTPPPRRTFPKDATAKA